MPFTLRSLSNEQQARLGVIECVKHKLLEPYSVLYDKDTEFIAQFKFTVLLMPSGSHKIAGLPVDLNLYESEYSITDESLKSLLSQDVSIKATKKKNKNLGKNDAAGDKTEAESNKE